MKSLYLQSQSGMTLVFSLIILATLTVISLSSMQGSRTEMSMAGNLRESAMAFNAAEAGLRAAESYVETSISKTAYSDPATGLFSKSDPDPDYSQYDTTWKAAATQDASIATSVTLPHVYQQPRFIVKYLGDRSQNAPALVNIGGYGSSQPGKTISNFRVTAMGVGQTTNSRRFVQSYFGKEF